MGQGPGNGVRNTANPITEERINFDRCPRHAYLFLAHANLQVMQAALRLIDDPRNDVFIYIDEELVREEDFSCKESNVYFLTQKIRLSWADFMPAEIELIKFAVKTYPYDYYHIMSDSCLPIKSQDEIHSFFDSDTKKGIYLHVNCHWFPQIQRMAATRYPFFHSRSFRGSKTRKVIAKIAVRLKCWLGVNKLRHNKDIPIVYNGWNWGSLPNDFAKYIVEKEDLLYRTFGDCLANEEVAFQSLGMNSHFRERMYGFNGRDDAQDASKRMIRWNPKHWTPLIFTEKDFDAIMSNRNCFFARKFHADVDMQIVRRIEVALTGKSPIPPSRNE